MATDSLTGMDGTQEPSPPAVLSDPLSGLVTGDALPGQRMDEFMVPRVAVPKPPKLPDATQIREALEAVLLEPARPVLRPPAAIVPAETPGIVQSTRQWPAVAAAARRLRATQDAPLTVHKPEPPLPGPVRRPAGIRTGMSVVLAIVLVTAIILFYVISSFADTIGKLFG